MTAFFCYILRCADNSLYTGWTTDVQRRLQEHQAGRGARYTRSRLPLQLVFVEEQPDRGSAMRREFAIKSLPRSKKLDLIHSRPRPDNSTPKNEDRNDPIE